MRMPATSDRRVQGTRKHLRTQSILKFCKEQRLSHNVPSYLISVKDLENNFKTETKSFATNAAFLLLVKPTFFPRRVIETIWIQNFAS